MACCVLCHVLYLIQEAEEVMTGIVFSCRLLRKMHIPHHRSQIAMTENFLQFGERDPVKPVHQSSRPLNRPSSMLFFVSGF